MPPKRKKTKAAPVHEAGPDQPVTSAQRQLALLDTPPTLEADPHFFKILLFAITSELVMFYFHYASYLQLEQETSDKAALPKKMRPQLAQQAILFFSTAMIIISYILYKLTSSVYQERQRARAIENAQTLSDLEKCTEHGDTTKTKNFSSFLAYLLLHSFWPVMIANILLPYVTFAPGTANEIFPIFLAEKERRHEETIRLCTEYGEPNCDQEAVNIVEEMQSEFLLRMAVLTTVRDASETSVVFVLGLIHAAPKICQKTLANLRYYVNSQIIHGSLNEQANQLTRIIRRSGCDKINAKMVEYGEMHAINLSTARKATSADKALFDTTIAFLKLKQQKMIVDKPAQCMFMLYEDFEFPDAEAIAAFTSSWKVVSGNILNNLQENITGLLNDKSPHIKITTDENHAPILTISINTPAAHYLKAHLQTALDMRVYRNTFTLTGNITDFQTLFAEDSLIPELVEAHEKEQEAQARAENAGWLAGFAGYFSRGSAIKTRGAAASSDNSNNKALAAAGPAREDNQLPEAIKAWHAQHPEQNVLPLCAWGGGAHTQTFFAVPSAWKSLNNPNDAPFKKLAGETSLQRVPQNKTGETGVKWSDKHQCWRYKVARNPNNVLARPNPEFTDNDDNSLYQFTALGAAH
jgi:hypothetical protein